MSNLTTPIPHFLLQPDNVPAPRAPADAKHYWRHVVGMTAVANELLPEERAFFTDRTLQHISAEVTARLDGVNEQGKPIRVSSVVIAHAMDGVFARMDHPGRSGSFPDPASARAGAALHYLTEQTIFLVADAVRTEVENIQDTAKLTVWTTVLGEHNEHGLRAHPEVFIRGKRKPNAQFYMRY
jgi:hypothetical protein